MLEFLCEEMKDYQSRLYAIRDNNRLFPFSKSGLYHEIDRCCKESGVKRIRVHDFRHPYVKHTTKKYNSEKQKTQTIREST